MNLTKDCKLVLNALIKLRKKGQLDSDTSDIINIIGAKKFAKIPLEKVLEKLQENGFITFSGINAFIQSDIQLTYNGIAYKELQWLELKAFVKKSIIVPIIVSAITTVAIPKIVEWLTPSQNAQTSITQTMTP